MRILIIVLASASVLTAQQPQEQPQQPAKPPQKSFALSTVEKLKGVESVRFDPALPPLFFGKWIKRMVRPAVPLYESRACESATKKLECVDVTAAMEGGQVVVLKFSYDPEQNTFEYLSGTVNSTAVNGKQSSKNIKKLSELIPILKPNGQAP